MVEPIDLAAVIGISHTSVDKTIYYSSESRN
jgi:hypothetical protein